MTSTTILNCPQYVEFLRQTYWTNFGQDALLVIIVAVGIYFMIRALAKAVDGD